MAVISAESSGNPRAVSKTGAQGLMQLEPATARDLGVTDAFDPAQNIIGGIKYLRQLLGRYKGNVPLALAAYNLGMGAVDAVGDARALTLDRRGGRLKPRQQRHKVTPLKPSPARTQTPTWNLNLRRQVL